MLSPTPKKHQHTEGGNSQGRKGERAGEVVHFPHQVNELNAEKTKTPDKGVKSQKREKTPVRRNTETNGGTGRCPPKRR